MRTVPKVTPDTSEADAREAAKRRNSGRKPSPPPPAPSRKMLLPPLWWKCPAPASVSYANYASVVKSVYDRAWTPPDDMSGDDANSQSQCDHWQ